jgi:aquaporin Z
MLMAWIYIGSQVSGAHYNPVVSFANALTGHLSWAQFIRYFAAQILGGFAAFAIALYLAGQVAIPTPGANVGLTQAFVTETLLAFVFALVALVVAHTKHLRASTIAGFVIAFTIPALALVGGPISGGLFNPAISLGANLLGIVKHVPVVWPNVLMYVVGGLLGGFLASFVYHHLIPADQR